MDLAERVTAIEVSEALEAIEARVAPLRAQVAAHPLYRSIRTIEHVRIFMSAHVFAVWDFMSLLKALQRGLTCVDLPWIPTPFPVSRRLINEIVLGEESDEFEGRTLSHFEIYLEAMERAGSDTQPIRRMLVNASSGLGSLTFAQLPPAPRAFVETTFRVIREGSLAAQAAAFAFGREDAIPDMFRGLVRTLNQQAGGELSTFLWYLERHIKVDGEEHGPLARKMVADLCGEDAGLWDEAGAAAQEALQARLKLWDGILARISE